MPKKKVNPAEEPEQTAAVPAEQAGEEAAAPLGEPPQDMGASDGSPPPELEGPGEVPSALDANFGPDAGEDGREVMALDMSRPPQGEGAESGAPVEPPDLPSDGAPPMEPPDPVPEGMDGQEPGPGNDMPTKGLKYNSKKVADFNVNKGKTLHRFSYIEVCRRKYPKAGETFTMQKDKPCWEVCVCVAIPE